MSREIKVVCDIGPFFSIHAKILPVNTSALQYLSYFRRVLEYIRTLTYRKNSENSLWSSILDWFFEGSEWRETGAAPS